MTRAVVNSNDQCTAGRSVEQLSLDLKLNEYDAAHLKPVTDCLSKPSKCLPTALPYSIPDAATRADPAGNEWT